jgi:hypothetical protein
MIINAIGSITVTASGVHCGEADFVVIDTFRGTRSIGARSLRCRPNQKDQPQQFLALYLQKNTRDHQKSGSELRSEATRLKFPPKSDFADWTLLRTMV